MHTHRHTHTARHPAQCNILSTCIFTGELFSSGRLCICCKERPPLMDGVRRNARNLLASYPVKVSISAITSPPVTRKSRTLVMSIAGRVIGAKRQSVLYTRSLCCYICPRSPDVILANAGDAASVSFGAPVRGPIRLLHVVNMAYCVTRERNASTLIPES